MTAMHHAQRVLLQPAGLTEQHLQQVLSQLLSSHLDYADLFFQHCESESWVLEDHIVKEGSYHIEAGVGIRANVGDKVGYAYSDDLQFAALEQAAAAAKSITQQGQALSVKIHSGADITPFYAADNPLNSMTETDKIRLLQEIDAQARGCDPRVKQVNAHIAAVHETVLIVTSEGLLVPDIRPLVRVNVSVVVEEQGRREKSSYGGGGRFTYLDLIRTEKHLHYAREAVRQALVNLRAVAAPAGTMPVVLGAGWPGVLLHEAVGHGLEGDFNRKGSSAFSGRLGEQVASPLCTVVDDGTLAHRRGSLSVDDEGTPGQRTVLIERGILRGYMQDVVNARLMGMPRTGNGRRESYAYAPMPRMTNTYLLSGSHDPREIIASVKKGVYAVNFDGGQVDITSGKFVFSASEAYLIENGQVTVPIKGATLIGSGPEVMKKISMLGNDLALDEGVGVCGKDGQSVPVGVGQPTLKIDELTVGGTAAV